MGSASELYLFNHCRKILGLYDGKIPLHHFLNNYFRQNKSLGSKDRRKVRSSTFNYFRLNKVLDGYSMEEKLHITDYVFSAIPSSFTVAFLEKNNVSVNVYGLAIEKRIEQLAAAGIKIKSDAIFPFRDALSKETDREKFNMSFLHQPYVWTRIKKGYEDAVKEELREKQISFSEMPGDRIISFASSTDLLKLESFEKGYFEIQDLSSQRTLDMLPEIASAETWWDCCAGSGGKSLLFKEKFPAIELLVSDKRDTILKNASERFKKAGVSNFKIFECDLEHSPPGFLKQQVDGIIADLPCTGSGTWARTPETLTFFNISSMAEWTSRQKRIIETVFGFLKPGGHILYITCSVFRDENEGVVNELCSHLQLDLIKSGYFKGYENRADTMFAALLKKPS